MYVPRYFRAVFVDLNLKLAWRCVSRGCDTPIPIASDLLNLIYKFEKVLYVLNSCRRFRREITGFVSENSMSSA